MKKVIVLISFLCGAFFVSAQQGNQQQRQQERWKPESTEWYHPVPPKVTPGVGTSAPSDAIILFDGKDLTKISDKHISAFRRDNLGFVFQDFNLLDTFNVADNIYLPLVLSKEPYALMKPKLEKLARPLGINHLLEKYPYEISGGQKQRVAVARALITHPKIILADEPTGALDSKSTDQLLSIFDQIHQSGQTILMVTHSSKAASYASRVLFIKDGQIFHQLYKGDMSNQEMYQAISDTLTMLLSGGQ